MIRQYTMFCKVLTFKKTGKKWYGQNMSISGKHSITCPACGSRGNCAAHGSYRRSLIDYEGGKVVYGTVAIRRVRCVSCGHSHAILPDHIIPYTTYSLLFILRVLAWYFLGLGTVEQLCRRYAISPSMLYHWKVLFLAHKEIWLGVLKDDETTPARFVQTLFCLPDYSNDFGRLFYQKAARSFLQRHRDAAFFHGAVF